MKQESGSPPKGRGFERGAHNLKPHEKGAGFESIERAGTDAADLSKPKIFIQKNRFTYTSFIPPSVVSIHFDARRGEIFFNGHNLRNMKPTRLQVKVLEETLGQIKEHRQYFDLAEAYEACLTKLLKR